jgi:ADP-dependent NAD(P)H-hydrate dehydratase / NAD(P)H-hydrate epimerase
MTLPDWLDPLYEAAEMRAADRWAIEERGVPGIELMERAGIGLARVTARVARPGPVRVVIGKGNNGGDGLVAARVLREDGLRVDVLSVAPLEELQGDARANLERLPGEPPAPFEPRALEGSAVVVDALLGTGFSGEPREPLAGAIRAIGEQDAPVVACDVPSGVDASTGEVHGHAVHASVTATFHGSKVGLQVSPGKELAGDVSVVEIGIPRGARAPTAAGLISERVLALVPRRERAGTKFSSGTVVVIGGARGLTGAPTMAALAAQRAGAGYVQVAVPRSVELVFSLKLLEGMTRALPDDDGAHVPAGLHELRTLAERAGALVLGPGIGRSDGAQELARAAAQALDRPLLIDADGLNAHAGRLDLLSRRPGPTVLTPHEGELGRLLGIEASEVAARRLACVRAAAEQSGCVVVLKGDDSLVAAPGGPVAISPGASPALATAGTGDVLSGMIGAFLAKGVAAFEAAAAGVLAHARAGQVAARRMGADHVVAGDVIEAIPEAMRSLRGEEPVDVPRA